MPCSRQSSKTGTPLSAGFRIPRICGSLNRSIFISNILIYLAEKILLLNPSNFRGDYLCLARSCPAAIFIWRQRTARARVKSRASRYPTTSHNRRDVSPNLAREKIHPRGVMAGSDDGAQAKDACCDRIGQ